jgi:hypothetical protein
MAGKKGRSDTRLTVARYQVDRLTEGDDETEPDSAGRPTMDQRAQFVEITIQQAMRRGDFDDLPGTGKPLTGLGGVHDPDWWIRRKIERERITGLGPPALTLRTEDSALDARLDAAPSEQRVRELLEDFNRRVIEARRQLLGGPPVITPTRDVDEQVALWRERRDTARQEREQERQRTEAAEAAMTRRERRRARRGR